jgi:hypothetical protein
LFSTVEVLQKLDTILVVLMSWVLVLLKSISSGRIVKPTLRDSTNVDVATDVGIGKSLGKIDLRIWQS